MFSELKRAMLKERRKAVKGGMPEWALLHADNHANRALFFRSKAKASPKCQSYARSLSEMNEAVNALRSFNCKFRRHTPLLDQLLKE